MHRGSIECYGDQLDMVFSDYYGLQYHHAGTLEFARGDGCLRTVEGAHAFISQPGTRFRYGAKQGETRSHHYVCFNGPRVAHYVESGLLPLNPALIAISDPVRFMDELKVLFRYLECGATTHDRAVHSLEGLFLQLCEQGRAAAAAVSPWVDALKELGECIRKKPESDWVFHEQAEALHLSYAHFCRLFGEQFQCPPGRYLLQCRLASAAQQLCETCRPVKMIAASVGIADVYHFSKLFRARYQLPPARYRKAFAHLERAPH